MPFSVAFWASLQNINKISHAFFMATESESEKPRALKSLGSEPCKVENFVQKSLRERKQNNDQIKGVRLDV